MFSILVFKSMKFIFIFVFLILGCGEKSNLDLGKEAVSNANQNDHSDAPRIIFFGDSLTAGYGLVDFEKSWPYLVHARLKKEGLNYEMTNAGVSGDTSSGGLGRIDWVLSQKPDIFVLELGANDMLRGIPPSVTRTNLTDLVLKIKKEYPKCEIVLMGMRATPNLGKGFRDDFDSIYPTLAKSEKLTFVPFLLERVAGIRKLNQKDGIHPTEEGHVLVANTVYPYIKKAASRLTKAR